MKINVHPLKKSELKPLISDPQKLGFCRFFSDRMLVMTFSEQEGWHNPEIKKYGPFSLDPSTMVFHYSQEIFEGLKAYHKKNGKINLFRPEMNAKRFNRSAVRLCMPTIPELDFLEGVEKIVQLEERWIPKVSGSALYIRPFMFGSDNILGVRASTNYVYCVILSPVGPYYKEGFNPISLFVSDEYVRSARGGVGEAKTGGNYAASLLAGRLAREKGCAQVLWLDAVHRRYVEEVGAMNIFFVYGNTLVTPKLTGSILPGITRDSVLRLSQHLGYKTQEIEITIDQVIKEITSGAITEIFGSGTAASISPVGTLKYLDKDYLVGHGKVGEISQKLYNNLTGIQHGEMPDPFNWTKEIEPSERSISV